MNPSFYRRGRTNQEMDSSLTASLFLLSVVLMQFVSAADQNNATIKAEPGQNVFLTCKDPDQGKITIAEWKRTDLGTEYVLLYKDNQLDPDAQHPSYRDRVDLQLNQLRKGDVSLILKDTTTDDSGTYECRIYTEKHVDELISTISLQVSPPEPFPVWAKVLLVLLVLVLVAAAGVAFYFWLRWKPVQQVEVKSGVESVLLPWRRGDQLVSRRSTASLPADVRVVWRDDRGRKVHVHQNGSDQPGEQHQRYKNRTRMDKNFSLTLSWPTCEDRGIFTCTVYRAGGRVVLMKKDVWLKVKVQQVEVEPGVKSVLLPCRTREDLDGDTKVEWVDGDNRKVHVYQNGSDQPGEQNEFYRTRTRMDKNLLKSKDLSLILMDPTISDTFTCRVYRGGDVLMVKQVQLEVKDQQVEVEEGEESVKLEFKVTFDLQGGDRVEWQDSRGRKVHVYQIGSDQPVEQAQFYRTRTRMNKDALETKDLSLTLDRPTERDISQFRCGVYRKGDLLGIKSTQLNLKAKKSLVQPKDTRMPLLADQPV